VKTGIACDVLLKSQNCQSYHYTVDFGWL